MGTGRSVGTRLLDLSSKSLNLVSEKRYRSGWFSNVWTAPINDLQNTVQAELDKTFESLRVMAGEKTIEQENLQV